MLSHKTTTKGKTRQDGSKITVYNQEINTKEKSYNQKMAVDFQL